MSEQQDHFIFGTETDGSTHQKNAINTELGI